MPGIRRVLLTAMVGASSLVAPGEAFANGGSYLEFDRTHYVPGDQGVALAYVSVPKRNEDLLEGGPFYLFAVPKGLSIREGRPIPSGSVRLGMFTIEEEKNDYYELRAAFTAPQLASDYYDTALCNDPCTIAGFGGSLVGTISIVGTRREAELLTENDRLRSRLFGVRREARRAEGRLAVAEDELETQLTFRSSERAELSAEIELLETQLAAVRTRAASPSSRTPFDPWIVGAILLVTFVAAALTFRRGRLSTTLDGRRGSRSRAATADGSLSRPARPARSRDTRGRRPRSRRPPAVGPSDVLASRRSASRA